MRKLKQVINAFASQDGDGVIIHRVGGQHTHQFLNPFLMLDEINSDNASDYIGGFPAHPHRGFETITYMKVGKMRHKDNMGNNGIIESGDVQWMTAGKGVIHSEMPEQENGLLHGFQIWLNLPANEKLKAAAYRDLRNKDIPKLHLTSGGKVSAVSGSVLVDAQQITGPLPELSTQPVFLDIELNENEAISLKFNCHNPALVFIYQGDSTQLKYRQMGLYSTGETLSIQAKNNGLKAIILSGTPIHDPIVQYGPFVMNSREEINQAIFDYQNNQFV
ncbi:quercetin 2,3-dioxygenase [Pseudoalteromonas sp. NBT06-2]|uniref:pirin family protein n=1 Tax=Pseudoalteromonas sp. NBT06-2 TaxID=2025950 RepID=UPI000BA7DB01|nr:pirin family protein [Pseudoalteromonas sp. NBT06-2]PAJ75117.1 quercetin 2,3-dioxygenase [Pseudoalteromonas sp. NBT06-2]